MGLTGGLDELPLADLVEMTALGGKTGRLTLKDEEAAVAGTLSFRDGRLIAAACGSLSAERAFYALLELKAGAFAFDPQAQLDDETCNLSTESLLMEGMRRIDEVRRLRHLMPAPAIVRLQAGEGADPHEVRVLGYLGPGARTVGDIVDGMLVGGDIDEYDTLKALARLSDRGVVRVEVPHDADAQHSGLPQPELER
jgi:Domain of unknown function (DUF4388)